jgi:hypothetical protein
VFISKNGLLFVVIISSLFFSTSLTNTFYLKGNSAFGSNDIIRPTITILKPSERSGFSNGVVEVQGTAIENSNGSGIKTVEVKVDNGEYISAKMVSRIWSHWSITLDMESSGSKKIVARVTDNAGNQNWDDITIIITGNTVLTRPSVKITQPAEYAIVSEDKVVVAGRASNNLSEVEKVQVRVNDGPYTDAIPSSPGDWSSWSVTLDFGSKAASDYKIVARALDGTGNQTWDDVQITRPFFDDFSGAHYRLAPGDISPDGKWYGLWDGGSVFGVKQDQMNASNGIFYEETAAVTVKTQTESALALTTQQFKDFKLSVDVRTDNQTRQNSLPNPWEVGWIIWKWNDNTNFYYFLMKTNGAEVGKYDGGENPIDQKILKTNPSFGGSIGQWMHWDIIVKGNHITIFIDGTTVFDFDDVSSFNSGTVGLYAEDAEVSFDNVVILPL